MTHRWQEVYCQERRGQEVYCQEVYCQEGRGQEVYCQEVYCQEVYCQVYCQEGRGQVMAVLSYQVSSRWWVNERL
jgi:hypothetical protein